MSKRVSGEQRGSVQASLRQMVQPIRHTVNIWSSTEAMETVGWHTQVNVCYGWRRMAVMNSLCTLSWIIGISSHFWYLLKINTKNKHYTELHYSSFRTCITFLELLFNSSTLFLSFNNNIIWSGTLCELQCFTINHCLAWYIISRLIHYLSHYPIFFLG